MKRLEWFHTTWRFLKPVLFTDLGIFAAVGLVCWFGGWQSAFYYGNGLIIAGIAAMAVGVLSLLGGWSATRSFEYQSSQMAGEGETAARVREERKDIDQSYRFLAIMGAAGLVVTACGLVVQAI